jgi:hypothetical protein
MSMTPGLIPNIRELFPQEQPAGEGEDVIVEIIEGDDKPVFDTDGNILEIQHADGSITVSMDGKPIEQSREERDTSSWFRNLAEEIAPMELSRISGDLMRAIKEDLDSRKDWIEDRAQGIKLLGLKIEIPGVQGASDGAPVEGMSKVRHPLLLEAVLRFQANARSELLPTDGPVKIRNDSNYATLEQDQTANALQRDMNHYLTSVAKEYYPDTDRMLLMLGFGGTSFKKVYFCPLRGRPVSESVDADDLIVNNAATDLSNAKRITHRTNLKPSTVKRLQILGVYRDVALSTPDYANPNAAQREKMSQQGISQDSFNPEDRDREIYECYCELDILGFEHRYKGKETGLEIPYRVTIDVSSKEILSIVRNYDEETQELPEARVNFVKYTFVPGLGFYDIGLLHILGNTTNAITAAWRELLDAGMYNNFPGFLMADTGARQNTNIFRVPPGGGALVKTNGMPITQAIMPLPYKEPSGALMNLVTQMADTGQRIGGTSEAQVGEGKADMPVGTTLALIEQATKVLNAVHKRMHTAQAEEFALLMRCFKEHPESFVGRCKKPSMEWTVDNFVKALEDCDLVPQADPNTASQAQRIMKVSALKQLAMANPSLYDATAVDTAALQAMGWSNPQQFMIPAEKMGEPSPEILKGLAEIESDKMSAEARMLDSQTRARQVDAEIELKKAEAQREMQEGQSGISEEMMKMASDRQNRLSNERVQLIDLAQDVLQHPEAMAMIQPLIQPALQELAVNKPQPAPDGVMPPVPGVIPQ